MSVEDQLYDALDRLVVAAENLDESTDFEEFEAALDAAKDLLILHEA